jgi:4-aminobutyrate aminotransferase/(S)-3-amino-2-methylpropionate transaminase
VKYPLEDHVQENKEAEARSLAEVERVIKAQKQTKPVAAVIIEPIASEGGDHHASNDFFRGLREITLKEKVALIVGTSHQGDIPRSIDTLMGL